MDNIVESLLNRGATYDIFRENDHYDYYEGMDADVEFWYNKYCENVEAGVNDPEVDVVEYIAGKIDEEHPTDSPAQFNSLMRWVRSILPEIERRMNVTIREGEIPGVMNFANGERSGKALAGNLAGKGIRDVTPGTNGRGHAEVDKTGIYVGVPMGPNKTAWANPATAKQAVPQVTKRVDKFQKAFAAAPADEKAKMMDWSPENPDMSVNVEGEVVDNNLHKVMPVAKAQPQAKSSILQKLGFRESVDTSNSVEDAMKEAASALGATFVKGWYGVGLQEGNEHWSGGQWAVNYDSNDEDYLTFISGDGVSPMNCRAKYDYRICFEKNNINAEKIVGIVKKLLKMSNEKKEAFKNIISKIDDIAKKACEINDVDILQIERHNKNIVVMLDTEDRDISEDVATEIRDTFELDYPEIECYIDARDYSDVSEDSYMDLDENIRDKRVIFISFE